MFAVRLPSAFLIGLTRLHRNQKPASQPIPALRLSLVSWSLLFVMHSRSCLFFLLRLPAYHQKPYCNIGSCLSCCHPPLLVPGLCSILRLPFSSCLLVHHSNLQPVGPRCWCRACVLRCPFPILPPRVCTLLYNLLHRCSDEQVN